MDLLDVLNAAAPDRRRTLDAWRRGRADAEAAEVFVREFVPLFDDGEVVAFLEAEGIWGPLAEMARASSGRTASTLWTWAATASWVVGDWADAPCAYAVHALRADPTDDDAWRVFAEVLHTHVPPDLASEVDTWARDPTLGPAVAARARAVLDVAASGG